MRIKMNNKFSNNLTELKNIAAKKHSIKKNDLINSFKIAAKDNDIVQMAEENLYDYKKQIEEYKF